MSNRPTPSPGSTGTQIGWASTSTMLGGLAVWGGLGWLADFWWGTSFATPIGAVLGLALGVYAVVVRYGRTPEQQRDQATDPPRASEPASLER